MPPACASCAVRDLRARADEDTSFPAYKRSCLQKLAAFDKSPKGSLDAAAASIVDLVNSVAGLVTTSSCSGRIAVYCSQAAIDGASVTDEKDLDKDSRTEAAVKSDVTKGRCGDGSCSAPRKGGGSWLYVSHGAPDQPLTGVELLACLDTAPFSRASAVLKVENFILHVACSSIARARALLAVAVSAGFRESGISMGLSARARPIVAVRCSAGGLEVPLLDRGAPLVPPAFAAVHAVELARLAGDRFAAAVARREKFELALREAVESWPTEAGMIAVALRAHQPSGKADVTCVICGGSFASRNSLFRHLLPASEEVKQPQCPAAAALASRISTIVEESTPKPASTAESSVKLQRCSKCGLLTTSRNKLFAHVAAAHSSIVDDSSSRGSELGPGVSASTQGENSATWSNADTRAAAIAVGTARRLLSSPSQSPPLLTIAAATATMAPRFPAVAGAWSFEPPESASTLGGKHPPAGLARHGHSAVLLQQPNAPASDGLVLVYGGFIGGACLHGRTNGVAILEAASGRLLSATNMITNNKEPQPLARTRHAAAAWPPPGVTRANDLPPRMLLVGGHAGPVRPLGDAWWLDAKRSYDPSADNTTCVLLRWTPAKALADAPAPLPRWSHSLTPVSHCGAAPESAAIILFGGRDASHAFGDVWSIRPHAIDGNDDVIYTPLAAYCSGSPPCARFSHAAAATGGCLVIHGGMAAPFLFGDDASSAVGLVGGGSCLEMASDAGSGPLLSDVHVLDLSSLAWSSVLLHGGPPLPRMSHCLVALPEKLASTADASGAAATVVATPLLILGGQWRGGARSRSSGGGDCSAAPVDGHGDGSQVLWLDAGNAAAWTSPLVSLDARAGDGAESAADASTAAQRSMLWPLRAAALAVPPPSNASARVQARVLILGGGGVVFAFGAHFSPPASLDISFCDVAPAPAAVVDATEGTTVEGDAMTAVLSVPLHAVELVRRATRALGLYDLSRAVRPLGGGLWGVPLTHDGASAVAAVVTAAAGGVSPVDASWEVLLTPLRSGGGGKLAVGPTAPSLPAFKRAEDPRGGAGATRRLYVVLAAHLAARGVSPRVAATLLVPGTPGGAPARIEWLGDDLVLISPTSLTDSAWGEDWPSIVATALSTARLARAAEVLAGSPVRATGLRLIYGGGHGGDRGFDGAFSLSWPGVMESCSGPGSSGGAAGSGPMTLPAEGDEPPERVAEASRWLSAVDSRAEAWVQLRQHGVSYTFDAARVMWSAGNVSEKARMAALDCRGETVVDLFCGVGYFTLPLLVRARAARLHAVDWNPAAIACLRMALIDNGVEPSRYRVWPGDNSALAAAGTGPPLACAHRVLLGLLPSSERAWPVALRLLRPAGGTIHVHANLADTEARAWADALPARLLALAPPGRTWVAITAHLERVKSYAPHVSHYVADVVFS